MGFVKDKLRDGLWMTTAGGERPLRWPAPLTPRVCRVTRSQDATLDTAQPATSPCCTNPRRTHVSLLPSRVFTPFRSTRAAGEISKSSGEVDTNLINIPFDKLQIRSGGYGAPAACHVVARPPALCL